MEDLSQLLNLIGKLSGAAVVGAGAAYTAFKFFAKNWLETKFEKQLSEFNHQQNIEIARLKVDIDTLLNGAILNQQKEFEILPTVWQSLVKVFHSTSTVFSSFRTYPNLNNYSPSDLKEFLKDYDWYESTKNRVINAQNKLTEFQKINTLDEINKAKINCKDFYALIDKNGIFIEREFRKRVRDFAEGCYSALNSYSIGNEVNNPKLKNKGSESFEKLKLEFTELENEFHKKLQSHGHNKN